MCVYVFFFFKQKTAYEMRISDWSSDVCSSDLIEAREMDERAERARRTRPIGVGRAVEPHLRERASALDQHRIADMERKVGERPAFSGGRQRGPIHADDPAGQREQPPTPLARMAHRSEEHTSELQSLMRTSYAVFCLKKKSRKQNRPWK